MEEVGLSVLMQIIGNFYNWIFNQQSAELDLNRQKQLFDYQNQYNSETNKANRLRSAGVSEPAIAQSLAGQQSNALVPAANSSVMPQSFDKLGEALMDSKLKKSEILTNDAERRNILLQGDFLPSYYRSIVFKSFSEGLASRSSARLNGVLRNYYYEAAKTISEKRPWEIGQMRQGLTNLIAEYDKILADTSKTQQDTETSASMENYYDELSKNQSHVRSNLDAQTRNLDADTEVKGAEYLNLNQDGIRLLFENGLRSAGFNPFSSFGQNITTLAVTNPNAVKRVLFNLDGTLDLVDKKLESVLGKSYKKWFKRGVGVYYLNRYLGDHRTKRYNRINSFTGAIGNMIPFAHPRQVDFSQPYGYSVSF